MTGEILSLDREWTVGNRIGSGGFAEVYEVTTGTDVAAAKFIPKSPSADRDLLLVDLQDAVNVVRTIDAGEHEDYWVLVMAKADESLRDHLAAAGGSLNVTAAVGVVSDVVDALVSLDGLVVHRDLKPENVLLLEGAWCLADFGISRYAEATTTPDTQKYAMSPPYAAPERWRHERASSAADVYAVGVMAHEMIAGARPFQGPDLVDYQQQHLHENPPALVGVATGIRAAIEECMFKAPGARPSPANLRARLDAARAGPSGSGLTSLVEANREQIARRAEIDRERSESRSAAEVRASLAEAGRALFEGISSDFRSAITSAAPSVEVQDVGPAGLQFTLGAARLALKRPQGQRIGAWAGWEPPSFDVVLAAELNLRFPPDRAGYEGRSHSLWYCDAVHEGEFAWYETAFMINAMIPRTTRQIPFALDPGEESAKALWSGMAEFQLAWPFSALTTGDREAFIDRWAGWLGEASRGRLGHPSRIPEMRGCEESFRRS